LAPPDGHFRLAHWNANSLVAHDFHRISLIESYIAINKCHLIGISETALKNDIPDEKIEIQGYTPIRDDLQGSDTHGGVLVYHKSDLATKNRSDIQNHPYTLVLELSISRKKLFYVLVYRKHGQTPEQFRNFIDKFDEMMDKINSENPYCIIVTGDFNAHLKEWWKGDKTDNFGTSIQSIFNNYGITQLVHQPTYIINNTKTCIDLVATDQPNLFLTNEIHPSLHTNCHHQLNFSKLSLKCPPPFLLKEEFGIIPVPTSLPSKVHCTITTGNEPLLGSLPTTRWNVWTILL